MRPHQLIVRDRREAVSASRVVLGDLVAVLASGAGDLDVMGSAAGGSLLDHGLRCAHLLRERRPDDLELQVAGLMHDVGQTLTGNDVTAHGEAAARFVRPVLGERVATLVRLHVAAKRYLVTSDPSYAARLSVASRHSLVAQGGPMSLEEVAAFEVRREALDALILRRCDDDAAATDDAAADPLVEWLPRLQLVADRVADRTVSASA